MHNFIEHFSCGAIKKEKKRKKPTPMTLALREGVMAGECRVLGAVGSPRTTPPKREASEQQAGGCIPFSCKGISL